MTHTEARRICQDVERARRIIRHQYRHSVRGKHKVGVIAVGSVLVVPPSLNDQIASITCALRKAVDEASAG